MNNYIISTAIKCSDGKTRRLSYDLTEQTGGSILEFGRVFTEIEKRFPDVQFWIQQYPEEITKDIVIEDGLWWNDSGMIDIHGSRDQIFPNLKNTDNEV